jgi:hypothetical protein
MISGWRTPGFASLLKNDFVPRVAEMELAKKCETLVDSFLGKATDKLAVKKCEQERERASSEVVADSSNAIVLQRRK